MNSTLQNLLEMLSLVASAAQVAGGSQETQEYEALAASLLLIAQKGVAVLEQHQGQPIDLTLLHAIDPVTDAPVAPAAPEVPPVTQQ